MSRALWAALLVAGYALLCLACWWRHRRCNALAQADAAALLPASEGGTPLLVLHASQTGAAEALAWQTARALHLAGLPVRVLPLGQAQPADLAGARQALFIAATCGEGDPPDSAVPFVRDVMGRDDIDLGTLHIAVLALGDATYAQFCGFGRTLDAWLLARGAQPLFPRLDVDREDAATLAEWRRHLSHVAGSSDSLRWDDQPFTPWRLVERRVLNPGSTGAPVVHLGFEPLGADLPDWQAGDLVQLQLDDAEDRVPREYTLASLPTDGRLELMVRLLRRDDGSTGRASGWLAQGLALGGSAALRLRAHSAFRIGDNAARPLILIGNGTGLAGLRAHLKARQHAASPAPAWLIYGERQQAHDAHYADEIAAWQASGVLAHADLAFSRDAGNGPRYVQHALALQRERLVAWVDNGAAIYVCGSLEGMAAGVQALLCEVLGAQHVDALIAQGRYRRDVY